MTNHKPKRADMDVRSSDDRVIVTDPSGSAVRTTAGAWDARWESVLAVVPPPRLHRDDGAPDARLALHREQGHALGGMERGEGR